jgi:Transposase DDE domain
MIGEGRFAVVSVWEAGRQQEFAREVLTRLPLAEAVLSLWRWVVEECFLHAVFARHHGAGCEKVLSFGSLVQLIADALLEHRGSGRKSFTRAQERGELEAGVQAVYQTLGRVPLGLSEAWLAESTDRVRPVYPRVATVPVPPWVQAFAVVVLDGKAIKRVAKRLKPRRGRHGGVLGGKALVALELATGLAVAMATDPDGGTNEAKLVPALLPQVRRRVAGPRLRVADSQFCDLTQTAAFAGAWDHFVVRYHPKTHFCPAPTRPAQHGQDPQGRAWAEDRGWLGCARAKTRRAVRRITLSRPGEETVIVITDLLDAHQYPATERLMVYLARWGIERVSQQITEVFPLQALIGTAPQGTVFQLAFCLLLYNSLQVVRAYVAVAQARPPATISTELLFDDVRRQLVALTELVSAPAVAPLCEPLPSPTVCASTYADSWRRSGRHGGSKLPRRNANPRPRGRRSGAIRPRPLGSWPRTGSNNKQ